MKKLLLFVALTVLFFEGKAQDESEIQGFRIGAGTTLAIPISNLDGTSIGYGVDVLAHYGLSDNLAVTLDAGYIGLLGKAGVGSSNLFPLRAGIRYFPVSRLFLGAKAGIGILSVAGTSITTTAYSVGAGFMISSKFDVGVAYEGYSKNGSFGYIGLRLGRTF